MRPVLVYTVCTWNRADRLPRLLRAMRAQSCPVPFEVLVVDNNSTDETRAVVERIAAEAGGAPVRYVFEPEQGIVPARNRAIEETLRAASRYLVFVDDDEIPRSDLLAVAYDALDRECADCVGGRICVAVPDGYEWIDAELRGFLGELDHGENAFWVEGRETPVWSGNVAYRLDLFRSDGALRFDRRYDRKGAQVGGGSDAAMFWALLDRGARIRYRPDMVVVHEVEPWRLRRSYFLRLHARGGYRRGRYRFHARGRSVAGVPPWLLVQAMRHGLRATGRALRGRPALREAMNAAYALGVAAGAFDAWRERRKAPAEGRA